MARVRVAAAILLRRNVTGSPQVYLVERNKKLRFFGGYWAMPGGVLDALDQGDGDGQTMQSLRRCAARELFEETNVVLDGGSLHPNERRRLRRRLLAGDAVAKEQFAGSLPQTESNLRPLCILTTPEFVPVRYRTQFFVADLPEGQEPDVIPGELTQGRFFTAEEALNEWLSGNMLIVPPVLFLLRLLAAHGDDFFARVQAETKALGHGKLHPIWFTPGVSSLR